MFEVVLDAAHLMTTRLQEVYLQQITTVTEIMKNSCMFMFFFNKGIFNINGLSKIDFYSYTTN